MADDNGGAFKGKVINFFFTSVLAGLVTTSFTYKSWREQTRLDLAKGRLAEATETFDKASRLMSSRVFYSYRVSHGVEGDDDAAFSAKLEKFDKAVEDWNLGYADLLQDFQFALEIDDSGHVRPYQEISTGEFEEKLRCGHAFDDSNRPKRADWDSPSWLLAALHHCFIAARVKQIAIALRQKSNAPTPKGADKAVARSTPPLEAGDEREQKLDALEKSIDDLKTHAEEVRVVGKKAIQRLRNATETQGFLQFLRNW